ncbi:MAG: tetratricopeptide repeat protein [Betaproteobacteria bacterium]
MRQELDVLAARRRDDPPPAVLRAARADALPEPLQTAAAAALERSAWSRTLVDGADAAEAELDTETAARILAHVRRSASGKRRGRGMLIPPAVWRPLLSVAAAVILVSVIVYLRQARRPGAPTAQAGGPAVAAGGTTTPAYRLPLDPPAIKLTAMALVVRSNDRTGAFVDDVAPAFDAYRARDYRTAVADFVRVQPRYPASVEIPFYLGVSRLLLNDPRGAVEALDQAHRVTDDTFRADVAWYLAVAHERAGNLRAARGELDALCGGTSAYATKACEASAKFPKE